RVEVADDDHGASSLDLGRVVDHLLVADRPGFFAVHLPIGGKDTECEATALGKNLAALVDAAASAGDDLDALGARKAGVKDGAKPLHDSAALVAFADVARARDDHSEVRCSHSILH